MSATALTLAPVRELPARNPTNPWGVAPIVALAAFMEVLDTTIANVALPHIAGNLAVTVDDSTWILTSYLVANAIVLPLNGFMSAVFGRKRYFMFCISLFTVSSLLVGLAPSFDALLVFRILQGLGGGGLQPGAQAIMRDIFPNRQIGMAMALYGVVVVVGPVIGPLLGGWITDSYSWRWCFLINVPVGIATLFLLSVLLPEAAHQRRIKLRETGIDYLGLGLLTLGIAALQIMLDRGEDAAWFASPFIRGCALVALLGLVSAFIWEWYQPHPMVDFRMLKDRNLGLATLGMLIFGVVLYSTTALLPLMVQTLMGYDAWHAGMVLAPGGVVIFCLLPLVGGVLVPRVPTRWLITVGVLGNMVALMMMGALSLQASFASVVVCRAVQGLGLAFLFVPFNTAAFGFISRQRVADASGILNLFRNIGGSIGIAAAVAYIKNESQAQQNFLAAHANDFNPWYHQALAAVAGALRTGGATAAAAQRAAEAVLYRMIQQQSHMLGYVDAYHLLAAAFLLVIPVAMLMRTPNFKKAEA